MCTVKKIGKCINSNILVTVKFQIWYLHTHMYLVSNFSLAD
jgi:hypothetical protein